MLGLVVAGVAGLVAPDLPAGALTIVAAIAALFGAIGLLQLIAAVQVQLRKPQKPRG
jgi:CDP-diacylglycerol--glycerol-3-phosphate 3-phosphatidyltransferase